MDHLYLIVDGPYLIDGSMNGITIIARNTTTLKDYGQDSCQV